MVIHPWASKRCGRRSVRQPHDEFDGGDVNRQQSDRIHHAAPPCSMLPRLEVIEFIRLKSALENTMRLKIVACSLVAFACSSTLSLAQSPSPSYVVKQLPSVRQSRTEWRKITPPELSCIEQRLRQQRSSVPTLIQRGILPSDSRLSNIRSTCRNQIAQEQQVTATVVQLPSQPIDGNARERDLAELRQTVERLQADLASSSDKIAELEKTKIQDVAELQHTIQTLEADLARSSDKIAELDKTETELELAVKKAEQATAAAENEKRQIEQASSELATKLRAINAQLQKDKEAVDAKRREWQFVGLSSNCRSTYASSRLRNWSIGQTEESEAVGIPRCRV